MLTDGKITSTQIIFTLRRRHVSVTIRLEVIEECTGYFTLYSSGVPNDDVGKTDLDSKFANEYRFH